MKKNVLMFSAKRRRDHHYLVKVIYWDDSTFGRVYTDKEKAERFAAGQKRSRAVNSVKIILID